MSDFYTNFVNLCVSRKVSPSGVATAIGLSNAAANGWKKGKMPSDTTLLKLSMFFGCSVEELTRSPAPVYDSQPRASAELAKAIRLYRDEHGLSTRAFARACGLSATYISALESGITARGAEPSPSLETYRAIAKGMGCTLANILQNVDDKTLLTDAASTASDAQYNNCFFRNYLSLCIKKGKSPSAVAVEMGFQRSVVSRWSKGAVPRHSTMLKIAEYFGCAVEELTKPDEAHADLESHATHEMCSDRPDDLLLQAIARMDKADLLRVLEAVTSKLKEV